MNSKVEYLAVRVIPKSPKSEIIGIMADGSYKIRLKALPEKGKANMELIALISKEKNIPKENIAIINGKNSRHKLLKIYVP